MLILNRFSSPVEFQPLLPLPVKSQGESGAHVYNVSPVPVKLYDWEREVPELSSSEAVEAPAEKRGVLAPVIGSIGLGGIRIDDPRTVVNFIQEAPRGFEPTSGEKVVKN